MIGAAMSRTAKSSTLVVCIVLVHSLLAACVIDFSETIAPNKLRLPDELPQLNKIPLHAGLYLTEEYQTLLHRSYMTNPPAPHQTHTVIFGEALGEGAERMIAGLFQTYSIVSQFDADLEEQGIDVVVKPTVEKVDKNFWTRGVRDPFLFWTTIRWDIVSPDGTLVYFVTVTGEGEGSKGVAVLGRSIARKQRKGFRRSLEDHFAKVRKDIYENPWWKDPWWKNDP